MRRGALGLVVLLLLRTAPVSAEDSAFRASMVAAVVAHGMDVSTTQRCLGSGRCRELNPWLARFEQPIPFAIGKMTVAALGIWATAKLHEKHPKWAQVINWAVAGGYSALAIRNARIGGRL